MRIGVLDVGSNSAHLEVVELRPGGPPRFVRSVKRPTLLAQATGHDGRIRASAVKRLVSAVGATAQAAAIERVDELIAYVTCSVRDAANREAVLARVAAETGVRLGYLSGRDEARLTFLAAREWYGWSAGPMLLLDIGGGTVEIAHGDGAEPALARSLPLGAGRLTREHLRGDPPHRRDVQRLRWHVYDRLAAYVGELPNPPTPARAVAASKTFKQLARLTGAPHGKAGPYARRTLYRDRLRAEIPRLVKADARRRAKFPGVAKTRVHQIVAGAIVAEALMTVLDIESADICPWALREGIMACRMRSLPLPAEDLADLIQHVRGARPLSVSDAS